MNAAHLHLLINHLPIIGSALGGFVLAYGLYTKSMHARLAGFYLLIIASVGGVIAYFSGEAAEDIMEHTDAMHQAIEAHEDFAVVALAALVVSGIAAVAGLIFTKRHSGKAPAISFVALLLALLSFTVAGYTGLLGGKIMHPETSGSTLNNKSEKPTETGEHDHEHDH